MINLTQPIKITEKTRRLLPKQGNKRDPLGMIHVRWAPVKNDLANCFRLFKICEKNGKKLSRKDIDLKLALHDVM